MLRLPRDLIDADDLHVDEAGTSDMAMWVDGTSYYVTEPVTLEYMHESSVRNAVRAGKPVPAEVRSEYRLTSGVTEDFVAYQRAARALERHFA